MAQPPTAVPTGPHIRFATFVENILEERDGARSLIRLVNRLNITVQGDLPAREDIPSHIAIHPMVLAIGLVGGESEGGTAIAIDMRNPAGIVTRIANMEVFLDREEREKLIRVNLGLPIFEAGLYWFNIVVAGQVLTRVPLRVIHERGGLPASQ